MTVANIAVENNEMLTERRYSSISSFTTFRHSATNRLHGSWQSNGMTLGVIAGAGDHGVSV